MLSEYGKQFVIRKMEHKFLRKREIVLVPYAHGGRVASRCRGVGSMGYMM